MKKSIRLLLLITVSLTWGCASTNQMYYWEDYSTTLYNYKKNTSDETLQQHMLELQKIIEVSAEHNTPVPPGIYGELGYYYLKAGKTEEAIKFFELEKEIYPESTIFMDRLLMKAGATTPTADENETISAATTN